MINERIGYLQRFQNDISMKQIKNKDAVLRQVLNSYLGCDDWAIIEILNRVECVTTRSDSNEFIEHFIIDDKALVSFYTSQEVDSGPNNITLSFKSSCIIHIDCVINESEIDRIQ